MKCNQCGSENEEDAKFCSVCGFKIGGEQESSLSTDLPDNGVSNEEEKLPQDDLDEKPDPTDGETQNNTVAQATEEASTGKQGKKKAIKANAKFFAVSALKYLGVFVIALILAVVFSFVKSPGFLINDWTYSQMCWLGTGLLFLGIPVLIVLFVFACLGEDRREKAKAFTSKNKALSKVVPILMAVFAVVFVFWPCPHNGWIDATCQHPKYCAVCGKEEGGLVDHQWVDATCQRAKHCSICGVEEGRKLEHDWEPATCTKPKTCKLCGATEGKPIDHTPGDWADKPDYVKGTVTSTQSCQVCGTALDTKTSNIDSFVADGAFSLPANDFVKRMDNAFSSISGCKLKADSGLTKNGVTMSIDIKSGSKTVATGGFIATGTDDSFIPMYKSSTGGSFWNLMITCKSDQNTAEVMYALIQTCDPALSSSEAHDVGTEALDNFTALSSNKGIGQASRNGITYSLAKMSGSWVVTAKVE